MTRKALLFLAVPPALLLATPLVPIVLASAMTAIAVLVLVVLPIVGACIIVRASR